MKKKILVVEDNAPSLLLVTDILDYHGFEVIQAVNGLQGLEMARKHHPDLILMDMQMPVMDGFEAIRQLRADERTAGIKIIAVTSFAMDREKQIILEAGADTYLSKPIEAMKLPLIVQQIIGDS